MGSAAYSVNMPTAAQPEPRLPSIPSIPPEATPRAIRAALVGEEVGYFDTEYRQTLAEAAETLDLTNVLDMLKRWQLVAWSTQQDPRAHRHMLDQAARLNAGQEIATKPWRETLAALGLKAD